jgi:sensor histidine kinase YesM
LSLQPIIENALQSDERIREQGLIRVSSSCEGDVYEIIVWDNGSGFQQKSDHENDPFHIGIQNVRERIESMCGGSMEVETFPNDGTIVTIKIPVKAGTKVS